jgi:hypothetical protein
MMNRAQFAKELQLGLNTVFGLNYDQHAECWPEHLDIETSRKAYEEDVLSAGLGAAQVKPEGSGVAYDEGRDAYVSRYYHETIALAFAITEEMVEDGLYGSVGSRFSGELAFSMQYSKEVRGADILNNGFNSSFPGGDGVQLFATTHPLAGGGTFSNCLATPADLSEAALEELLLLIADWTDERGKNVRIRTSKLIVPNALQFVAERILGTPGRPGTADNDINAIRSMNAIPNGYVCNPYLTDTNAWFLKTDCRDGLKHFVRVRMQRGMEGEFESGNLRYKARERYSNGWSNARGAAGSSGST